MPAHRDVPNWRYGDILRYDDSRYPTDTTRVMFLGWEYTDSVGLWGAVAHLLVVKTSGLWADVKVGDVLKPYCGWWDRVDE